MGEIMVNGKPFVFEDMSWYNSSAKSLDKEDAKYILSTVKRIFDRNGIHFKLNFGTLLGAIREHDFIGHDVDIDLAVHERYREQIISLIPELYDNGIKLCRYFKKDIYSFIYKGIICDIDIVFETPYPYRFWFYRTLEKMYPKKYTIESEYIEFLGEQYEVPKNPERFLEYMYGKNWRIPQKGKQARLFPDWMIIEKFALRVRRKIRFLKEKHFSK